LSQEALAEILSVDRSTIVRWERAETDPQPWHRPRLAEALKITIDELADLLADVGGAHAGEPAVELAGASDAIRMNGPLAKRRLPDVGAPVAANSGSLDHRSATAHAERLLRHFLSLEAEVGGNGLYASLAEQVEQLAPTVDRCARPTLLSAFGQLCQLTGWLALDANRHDVARQYLCMSVLAAHQADEPALAASALAYMSLQETYRDNPGRALALAKTAHDMASGSATRCGHTMLATRLARAHAKLGNKRDALAAAGRAEDVFASSGSTQPEPLWLSYVDQREVTAQKGACYLDLGMPREAVGALTYALQLLDRHSPSHARDRVHYLSRLAKCHLLSGDLDQACGTAHEALDAGRTLGSARVLERIGEFHAALAPHAGYREARTFRDRFSAFLQSR
jgi:tetratricopeptide (TPR) repeat protein